MSRTQEGLAGFTLILTLTLTLVSAVPLPTDVQREKVCCRINHIKHSGQMDTATFSFLLDHNGSLKSNLCVEYMHDCIPVLYSQRDEFLFPPCVDSPLTFTDAQINRNTSALCRRKGSLLYPAIIFHLPSWHSQPPFIYFQGKLSQEKGVWKLH